MEIRRYELVIDIYNTDKKYNIIYAVSILFSKKVTGYFFVDILEIALYTVYKHL